MTPTEHLAAAAAQLAADREQHLRRGRHVDHVQTRRIDDACHLINITQHALNRINNANRRLP